VDDVCIAPSKLWVELSVEPGVTASGADCGALDTTHVLLDRELGLVYGFAPVDCAPWSGADDELHVECSATVVSEHLRILVEFELVSDWLGDGYFIARATLEGGPEAFCEYRYDAKTFMIWA
jgi:hypothetical protein